MRRVEWCVCAVLLVGIALSPTVRAQGTVDELLRAVPADATAAVVVRSFTDLQQDLAVVVNTVVAGQGMALSMMMKQALGAPDQGLNLQNSLGFVAQTLEGGDVETGVLLPVTSYTEFSNALQQSGFTKTTEEGLDAYSVQGFAGPVTYYAVGDGAYRFWTQSKMSAVTYQKKFQAQEPTLAAELPTDIRALMADTDLSVYAPMSELAPRVQSVAATIVAQMQAASLQAEVSEEQAEQMRMAQKVLMLELDTLGEVLDQLDWGLVTVDINPDGITARAHVTAKPESTAARFFQAQRSGETALLGQLPEDSWMAVSGTVDLDPVLPALKDFSTKIMEAMSITDEETMTRYEQLLEKMDLFTGEIALAMVTGGESESFVNLVELFTVTDPVKALESVKDGVMMWQGTPAGSAVGGGIMDFSKAEITSPLETYRGVEVSQVTVPITVPGEMPPQVGLMMQNVYGEQFAYEYGAVGNTVIVALGTRANELIKGAIDGLKDGATGLAQKPEYQSATMGLPKGRSVTGHFSLLKAVQAGLDLATGMAGGMGGPAPPLPDIASLQGITPSGVGLALSFEGPQASVDMYVPQAELANLGVLVTQIMQSMGGTGGPGQPMPMPPPMQ